MSNSKYPFTVSVDGNIVVIRRFGTQTAESVGAIRREVKRLMEADKSVCYLLSIVQTSTAPDTASLQASLQNMKEIPYERAAIVAVIPQRLVATKGLIQTSEVGERAKLFRSEEAARAWLAE